MTKKTLTAAEVAEFLGVCTRSVWKWVATGAIPQPIRITSRKVVWLAEDLEAWLEQKKAERR